MAFFNDAFYSSHSQTSTPSLGPGRTNEFDAEIDQALDDAVDFLSSSDIEKLLSSPPRTNTPQVHRLLDTPPSSVTPKPTTLSDAKSKRVDFAPFTSTNWGWAANARLDTQKENSSALLRTLQPSKERSTLRSKSILKPASSRANEQSSSPEMQATLQTWSQVLDSGLRQLRSDKPGMRLDAWRSMQQFLSTLPAIEHHEELGERHNALLTNFVRDISYTEKEQGNGLPNQLPNFALKFMSKLVRLPGELSSISLANLLDMTIEQIRRPDISKNLFRCYMDFLYQQNFGQTIMTSGRTRKIVQCMRVVDLHQSSSGILLDQIKVYKKFVEQSPEGMIASASDWLPVLLNGLFVEDSAVFRLAVDAAFDIAVKLGHRVEVAKAMQKLLWTVEDTETGTKLQQLEKEMKARSDFANDAEQALAVPKMLSAVFMFLRAKGPSAVLKDQFKPIVYVLKPYLMRTTTASQAYTAWSWLVIAQNHGGRWPEENRTMLKRPLETLLAKATVEIDFERGAPGYALSTYLVLLYCSFSPDTSHQAMTQKWDLYVSDIVIQMLGQSRRHIKLASDIICALLSSSAQWDLGLLVQTRKPWNSPMLQIKDLARIDPSWVRSNLDTVLRLLDNVFKSTQRYEHSVPVFKALIDALARAGDNEIVPTKEAKQAVSRVTNYLTQLWISYSRKAEDIVLFGQLLEHLLDEPSKRRQGQNLSFTEKILRKSAHGEQIEVATTPSHRSGKEQPISAMAHFLDLMTKEMVEHYHSSSMSQELDEPSALYDIIKDLTQRQCMAQPTLLASVTMLSSSVRKFVQVSREHKSSDSSTYINQLSHHGLVFIADLVASPATYGHAATGSLEQGYQHVASMMSDVACFTTGLSTQLSKCYRAIIKKALSELGLAGALLCVTEANARNIHHSLRDNAKMLRQRFCYDSTLLDFAQTIVETAPSSVPSVDIRKALERFANGRYQLSAKKADLYELFHMSNHVLAFAYEHLIVDEDMVNALTVLISSLSKTVKMQSIVARNHLRVMQGGIAAVIMDKQGKIFTEKVHVSCSNIIYELWNIVLSKQLFEQNDKTFFTGFDELISAGLSSRSSRIINEAVAAWNKTYGRREDLTYPPRIAKALRKLEALGVDLVLCTSLPAPNADAPDSPLVIMSTESTTWAEAAFVSPSSRLMEQLPRLSATPAPTVRRRPASATPKPKLKSRHEDTQIHFEPIVTSPPTQVSESMFTDRQKEVAERQREDAAALFAEVSSPVADRMRQTSAELPEEENSVVSTPLTPVLATAMDDAIPSSSPVAASVRRRESTIRRMPPPELSLITATQDPQVELPSSPPAMLDDQPKCFHEVADMPALSMDRYEDLRRERLSPVVEIVREMKRHGANPASDVSAAKSSGDDAVGPDNEPTIPSTAVGPTRSFNGISNPVSTESSSTRICDSFLALPGENQHIPNKRDAAFVAESFEDSQDGTTQSFFDDSQATDSRRKKRKRGRASFATTKRRKTDVSVYNTTRVITVKPKTRFTTPDGMLPFIIVKVPGEPTSVLSDAKAGVFQDSDEDIQVPATAKRVRRNTRKSHDSLKSSQSQVSQVHIIRRKRGRSSFESQDVDVVMETENGIEGDANAKRTKIGPKTPSSRASSVHYVGITPGDVTGRRSSRMTRTDTLEAKVVASHSQQTHIEGNDTACEIPTSQIKETQEQGAWVRAEEEEDSVLGAPIRSDSPAPSTASSSANSQASTSSQISSFSVSAIKGVMSRYIEQIKQFVTGGNGQALVEEAERMADEANRTVEKLVKAARKNRAA